MCVGKVNVLSFIGFERRKSCLFNGAHKEKVYAELCIEEVEE
jgi:hypothetical protein